MPLRMQIISCWRLALLLGYYLDGRARASLANLASQSPILQRYFLDSGRRVYLLNNFLPFRLGEIGRAFLLSRKSDMTIHGDITHHRHRAHYGFGYTAVIFVSAIPFVVGLRDLNEWASL